MRNLTATDIVLGIFYLTAALSLCIVAYKMFIRKYKRNKLVAMNSISLVTSKDNVFSTKTKFLLVVPTPTHVKVELLDSNEQSLNTLVDAHIDQEEYPFDFNPEGLNSGKYYLYLTADNAKILRGITIA
ncbi:MAG: hypothetical protein H6582_03920 [Crocinitomicaceae bacterium]|nr:hypothetical protein [Crocinitomicaceae bacterium]